MEILNYQFKEEMRMLIREEMAAVLPKEAVLPKPVVLKNQIETCKFLDITEPTIIRWRNKGKIPFMQIGSAIRYDLSKVLEALEVGKKKGAGR